MGTGVEDHLQIVGHADADQHRLRTSVQAEGRHDREGVAAQATSSAFVRAFMVVFRMRTLLSRYLKVEADAWD